jgi:hypothetical protein
MNLRLDPRHGVGTEMQPQWRRRGGRDFDDRCRGLRRVAALRVIRHSGPLAGRARRRRIVVDDTGRALKRDRIEEVDAEDARLDDDDVDAEEGPKLGVHRFAQPLDRELRRRVYAKAGCRGESTDGAQVDGSALAVCAHRGDDGLATIERGACDLEAKTAARARDEPDD